MTSMTKTALITGGTRGIGLAIALNLAKDHNVVVVWNSTAPKGLPDDILAIQSDLTQDQSCASVVRKTIEHFGRLDVVVNNAGLAHSTPKDSFDGAAQRAILDVNVLVPSDLLAASLPYLKPGSSVVNISSINAVLPPRTAAIFGASKAALNLWTRAMAKELGPQGIRVNAVAPGAITVADNPRPDELNALFLKDTALGRLGEPEDIARVVRFLASEDAGFITGEILSVAGGYRL
ncbi:SDR family oxidoreductase [Pseudosulfitobacter sp. SM2401]|uniref:SDR family NAD(P)-dependent oxidoreductase n=1 Tax=Pseudosulfitobacter sp. SM2401 TaxID=3350098 RepID=UPI0036F3AB7E